MDDIAGIAARRTAGERSVTAPPFNPRVLIADDDPTMLLLYEHALAGLGRSFDAADNGTDAWNLWLETRHPLVVIDIGMPGLDGLDVCRRIRETESLRQTFLVVVTGRDRAADLEEVLAAGADDYMAKPVMGQALVARLRIVQRRMVDDAARRSAEEELRKARWLAGIGEATIAIQHEINNPVAALMATAELLLLESQQGGLPTEDLQSILDQAGRIKAVVKRLENMQNPQAVSYVGDARMVDLRERG